MSTKEVHRVLLPTNVTPSVYRLTLAPNLETFDIDGFVSVDIRINEATNTITLHGKDIKILEANVQLSSEKSLSAEVSYDDKNSFIILTLPEQIQTGNAIVNIKFLAILTEQLAGFYRSSYTTETGEKRFLATSQFQPADARRAFPCWDEPALKAQFEVTIIAPEDRVVLSNMPIASQKNISNGKKEVSFERTPIMSTYLLAFVVGEFDSIEGKTKEGTTVRVFTQKGKSDLGKFGLDVGLRCLSYYNDLFQIPYPLPKQDMIAIPDFNAGAMENWGLITYRETALLLDEKKSSIFNKIRVAEVVCHELAHQWFGNLVTMEWWVDLWLNEGFATWCSYHATHHLFPNWEVWLKFITGSTASALNLDAMVNSHPIEVDVSTADEINEIFDAISYCKGSSVIRMVASYLTEEVFFRGLVQYLKTHAYGNAKTTNLWTALSAAYGKDIGTMMATWTSQSGFPVLTISTEGDKFVVEQRRYLSSGEEDSANPQWIIPLSYITDKEKKPVYVVMDGPKLVLEGLSVSGTKWVKFNPSQTSFYRVKYPEQLSIALAAAIKSKELGPEDRVGLLQDVLALAKSGKSSSTDVLELVDSFVNEDNTACWSAVISALRSVESLIQDDSSASASFGAFVTRLLIPLLDKLGWDKREDEESVVSELRVEVIATLANYRYEAVVEEAKTRFQLLVKDGLEPAGDLKATIFKTAVKYGGKAEYEFLLNRFRTSDLNDEKLKCLVAMAGTQDESLFQPFWDFALEEVRHQDMIYAVSGVINSGSKGRERAWIWVTTNWAIILQRFGGLGFTLPYYVSCFTFSSREKAEEVKKFFETHEHPGAQRAVAQVIEKSLSAASWKERDGENIKNWLIKHIK